MILTFGWTVISLLIVANIISLIRPKLKTVTAFSNLVEYATADRIFRIIQYASLGTVGLIQRKYSSLESTTESLSAGFKSREFQKLTTMMSRSRKAIRFLRAPLLLLSIRNRKLSFAFTTRIQTLSSIEQVTKLISDLCDLTFFLTDHYSVFYLLGITGNAKFVDSLGLLGDIMWICCSFFFLLSILCVLQKNRILIKDRSQFFKQREVKIALMDFFSHTNEVILGFTFIFPTIACKEVIATMVIASTVMRLCKFGVK